MADIFISYKREDGAACAAFADALVAQGYTVWFDRDIREGDSWDRTIEREIGSASAVLVLWSRRSRESDWVRNEARFAKQASRLLPVRIEHCELPLEFAAIQTVDVFDLRSFVSTPGWGRLLDRVDAMIGRPRPGAIHGFSPEFIAQAPEPGPTPSPYHRLLFIIAVSLAVIATGVVGMAGYLQQRPMAAIEQPLAASPSPQTTPDTISATAAPLPGPQPALPTPTPAQAAGPSVSAEANVEEVEGDTPCERAQFEIAAQPAYVGQYTVQFDPNSARLSRQAQQVVREAADFYLARSTPTVVRVIGERRRRQVVRDLLIAQGLPEHRVGTSAPLCGQDRAQRALEVRIWLGA